ncbi:MAG TPA: phenylacetate--CoA ligase family protein [Burkholderiaceae bacterium]|nr:phenylacetate--CoA ligase family protein [Burkholderiaceae bacterium]
MSSTSAVFDAWRTACVYADAVATSHASGPLWRDRQAARLDELLREVAPRSRLYRARLAAAGHAGSALETLGRIRPVRKRELMQHFDAWVTDPALSLPALRAFTRDPARRGQAFLGRYLVWESSGSRGEPALFVQDERSLAVADALEAARGPISLAGMAGLWSRATRIALVGATTGHFASVVAFERVRELNPWLGAASRSFSFLQPIAQLVAQLNAFAPTVLASYPSMAWVLAEEQAAGRLALSLEGVWTGGETLTATTRRVLGARFHAPVRDSYGASECYLIANECRCGRLHLNADWVVLEPVDRRGRPVAPGEVGHTTLLTHLANHVQPIIRYDLGDRVRFVPGDCACGSGLPVIEVQGRSDDVLTLDDDHGHAVHLAPLALTTVLEDEAGVFDFQLRQRGLHGLRLDLYPCADAARAGRRAGHALRGFLQEHGLGATRVEVHHEARPAARGRSGKCCRVVCDPRRAVLSARAAAATPATA